MRNTHPHINPAKDTKIPVQTCEKRTGGSKYNRINPQRNINITQQALADKFIQNVY